ncbi:hypothetical protein PR202_ga26274 [Eleusine coracana subsp. coracana]|uniref:Uncharacterized protein n=1 Tax=Eleusine coracana subsp. coracana TaxID=191504 RepID=A0AAV5DDT3_ELECO|nr:hypothetical protein PR202_ga26274 [Eleusine coracana subsp. coracana]
MQRTAGTADADAEGARVELGVELKGAVGRAAASGRGGRAGEGGGSVRCGAEERQVGKRGRGRREKREADRMERDPPLPAIGSSHFRRRLVSAAPATTMEVDMDMDMPDLEELEWMESHSFLPEEEEEAYFDDPEAGFFPLPGDSPQPQEAAAPPAKHRRYAPTHPRGLLSESFQSLTRRAEQEALAKVLLWIKQWDSCVFGSHIRATSGDVLSALRRHSSTVQKNSSSRNFFYKGKGGTATSQNDMPLNASNGNPEGSVSSFSKRPSADNTPEQKVLLLLVVHLDWGRQRLLMSQPNIVGTMLWRSVRDDRSASSIESKILDVVQMNSIMSDSKPKCLIIDEIDGALGDGKGAVEVILKMINAEKNNNADSSTTDEIPGRKASSRKSHRSAKLLRPVSIEAMALASVYFGYSLFYLFRLKYICKKEGFKTSAIALSALAEYTECDIRSCLNTLQFLNKKRAALNIILQKKKLKRAGKTENHFTKDNGIDSLFSLISNRGDYEVTMDGIHENFLRLSYHDPMLKKTVSIFLYLVNLWPTMQVKCIDVLGISDCLTQYVWRTQQMSLQAYQPLIAINISRMVAQVEKPNIEWPKASQRYFLHIISFYCLWVALNLLSEREKKELVQIVDTMVSYSVTYKNTKFQPQEKPNVSVVSHDVHSLSFDPPINDIIRFKGYQSEHIGLSLAMKQVLLHEVEKQRIIKGSAGKLLSQTNGEDVKGEAVSATREKATNDPVAPTLDSSKDSFKRNSTTLQMQLKPSSNLSGLGRKRPVDAKTRNDAGQHGATVQRDSRPLIFKYNEHAMEPCMCFPDA